MFLFGVANMATWVYDRLPHTCLDQYPLLQELHCIVFVKIEALYYFIRSPIKWLKIQELHCIGRIQS
jgi:hypothetical protein